MNETAPSPDQYQPPHFEEVEDVTWKPVEEFWENADTYIASEPDPLVIEVDDGEFKTFSPVDAVKITSEEKWDPVQETFVKRDKQEIGARRVILEADDGEKIEMPVNAYLWEMFGDHQVSVESQAETSEPSEIDRLEGALQEFKAQFSEEEFQNMWRVHALSDGNALNALSPEARENLGTYEKLMDDLDKERRKYLGLDKS